MTGPPRSRVRLFHLGPPKCGTTWIYRCLAEHPEVAVPPRDSIHFFSMFFSRGDAWYEEHFRESREGAIGFDPSPSYFRSPWAPRRIAGYNPDARLAVCLRNPVDRAFSHYWHEKKKGRFQYQLREMLRNYDLFASWLEPGFYAEHLGRFLEHFPREQILVQRFEALERDPAGFLRELLEHFGVDPSFEPSVLHDHVNAAGARHTVMGMGLHSVQRAMSLVGLSRGATFFGRTPLLSGRGEYVRGIPDDLRDELQALCEPEITRLESLLGIDLAEWRNRRSAPSAA